MLGTSGGNHVRRRRLAKLEIYLHAREAPIAFDVTEQAGGRMLAQYGKKLAGEEAQDTFRIQRSDGVNIRLCFDLDQVVGIVLSEENSM